MSDMYVCMYVFIHEHLKKTHKCLVCVTEWPVSSFTDHFHLHLITYQAHLLLITTVIRTWIKHTPQPALLSDLEVTKLPRRWCNVDPLSTKATSWVYHSEFLTWLYLPPVLLLFVFHDTRLPYVAVDISGIPALQVSRSPRSCQQQRPSQNPSAPASRYPRITTHLS